MVVGDFIIVTLVLASPSYPIAAMLGNGGLRGSRGGLRVDHAELDGQYLRSEAFVELVRSGYVGTRGATTRHLRSMIEATLNEGRAVVAAIHHSFR